MRNVVISYAIGDIFSDKLHSKQLMKTLFITFYDAMPSIFYPSIKKVFEYIFAYQFKGVYNTGLQSYILLPDVTSFLHLFHKNSFY